MENPDPNDSDAINNYIDQLSKRMGILQGLIDGFTIAGPGISGDVETGFTFSDTGGRIEQGEEQTDEGQ